jgi:hypothetical protein
VTETSGDAKALADVVRLIANMAMLQSGQRDNQYAAEVLKSLTVNADDRSVNVSLAVSGEQLERMLVQAQRRPKRSPAQRLRRGPNRLPDPQPVR